jgi:NAD(P)-dependent dehydrogenase (short-subunit alcohol dehydrogenase family)
MAGRVAFVTGAGSGMGQLYARRLLDAGWAVAALDVNAAGLAALGERSGLLKLTVDVRDAEAVKAAAAQTEQSLGAIVRVINAAAIMPFGALLQMDPLTVRRIFEVNVLGLVNVAHATMPGMVARGTGEFVSFCSLSGHVPIFFMGAYSASKSATVTYTEVLYQENRRSGVHVACVCPPAVHTPLLEQGRATRWPRFLDVLPPIQPELVIDRIETALARRRFWVFPGWYTWLSAISRRLMPGVLWSMVRLIERPDHPV